MSEQYKAALKKIRDTLMNMQPHIEQACLPGRRQFIDTYVDIAMETAQQALDSEPAQAQPAQPVDPEFIADLQRSRTKHPGIKRMFDGLLGELHELKRAYGGDGDIRAEAFDVAVCAYRIATEGDLGFNQKLEHVPDWMAWNSPAPTQPVQPVEFLADGRRYKVTQYQGCGVHIGGLPLSLNGRWVALVAADDNCHLNLRHPPADVVQQLVDVLMDVSENAKNDSPEMWQRVDDALAAAREAGL